MVVWSGGVCLAWSSWLRVFNHGLGVVKTRLVRAPPGLAWLTPVAGVIILGWGVPLGVEGW